MNFSSKYVYQKRRKSDRSNLFDNSVITEQSEKDANLIASPHQKQEINQYRTAPCRASLLPTRLSSPLRSPSRPSGSILPNDVSPSMNKRNEICLNTSIDLMDEYEPGY